MEPPGARRTGLGSTSKGEVQMAAKKKAKQAAADGKPQKVKKKKTSRGK
jgi:hypothetical protein